MNKYVAPLGDMHRSYNGSHRLGIDTMGPLPLSHRGNEYIQVVTDSLTTRAEMQAIPDMTATTCAAYLVDAVTGRFVHCLCIVTKVETLQQNHLQVLGHSNLPC